MRTAEECVEAIKNHLAENCVVVYFDRGNGSSGPWRLDYNTDEDDLKALFSDVDMTVEEVKDYIEDFAEAFDLLEISDFNGDDYDCVLHTTDKNGYELFYLVW